MSENNYFKVSIRTEYEDRKGNMKYQKQNYVVFAISPTDVEEKMAKQLQITGYEIVSISLMNIVDVIK